MISNRVRMTHLGPGLCPHNNLWQAFAVGCDGERVDLGTFGFAADAVAAINYHEAYHGRELINVPTSMPGSPPRYPGVRPNPRGGWDSWIHIRGGNTERLTANAGLEACGVFGFAVDGAVARNYFIAYSDDPYIDQHDKFNTIREGENHHD
jgi:hypothetical protein